MKLLGMIGAALIGCLMTTAFVLQLLEEWIGLADSERCMRSALVLVVFGGTVGIPCYWLAVAFNAAVAQMREKPSCEDGVHVWAPHVLQPGWTAGHICVRCGARS